VTRINETKKFGQFKKSIHSLLNAYFVSVISKIRGYESHHHTRIKQGDSGSTLPLRTDGPKREAQEVPPITQAGGKYGAGTRPTQSSGRILAVPAGDHPITSLPSTPPALLCISPSSPNSTPAPFSLSPPKNNNVPHLRLTSSHLSICLYSFGCQSFFSAVPFSVLSPLSLSLVSPLSISGPSFVFFFYSLFS
jgi:hypothetical protein